MLHSQSVGGIAVSIAAFQAVDPGSTPGHRKLPFLNENSEMMELGAFGRKISSTLFFQRYVMTRINYKVFYFH